MKNKSKPKYFQIILKGSLAVSIAEMSTKIVGLLLIPVFTSYLSPTDYGIVSLTLLIVTCLNLLYNPGMLSAATRLYHATNIEKERQLIVGSAYRFFSIAPIFLLLLGIIFGEYITNLLFDDFKFYPYGILALCLALFTQVKRVWSALMTLQYKIHITAVYSLIAAALGILTSILLVVVFKLEALGRVLALFPSAIFLYIVSFRMIKKFTNNQWSFNEIKRLLKFGSPLILAIWSYEILNVADRFIIEEMLGVAALGIYSFSYTIGESQKFLLIGIKQLWSPIFYENMNNKNYAVIQKLMSLFIIIVTIVNAAIILFGKEFVLFAVNDRYHESINLIGVIVTGLYFNSLLIIFSSSLAFKNKFGSISKIATFSSLLNILLNICLIPYLGLFGCALATLISYAVYFIIGFFIERKTMSNYANLNVLSCSVITVLSSFLLTLVMNSKGISVHEILIKLLLIMVYIVVLYKMKVFTLIQIQGVLEKIVGKIKKHSL